jgi:catechol 2,3-dioxygenase-like lactoylglutathione lyase family enzyme
MTKLHLSIDVSDLARSVVFYEAFFGATPHKTRPGYANFDLAEPPLKFALNESSEHRGRGALNHLGFLMATTDEVLSVKARLQAAGLATFDEMDTTCCYAKQDKIWVHDPDGNAWEVYTLTDDLLDDHEHDHAGNALPLDGRVSSPALLTPPAGEEAIAGSRQTSCCLEGTERR